MKLTPEARRLRKRYLREYDIADQGGLDILDRALEAFCRMREAEAVLDREGLVVENRFKELREHPMVSVERKCRAQFLDALRRLNLDVLPASHLVGRPPGG